jgi:hypothetical protein
MLPDKALEEEIMHELSLVKYTLKEPLTLKDLPSFAQASGLPFELEILEEGDGVYVLTNDNEQSPITGYLKFCLSDEKGAPAYHVSLDCFE